MKTLLPLVFLCACSAVPHEVVVANAVERQAAMALQRDEEKIIKAYDKEVRRMAGALLDAQQHDKLQRAASVNGSITLAEAEAILSASAVERAAIMTQWENKRDEFLVSPNRTILLEMNATLGRYLNALDESARALEDIIGVAKGIK